MSRDLLRPPPSSPDGSDRVLARIGPRRLLRCDLAGRGERWLLRLGRRAGCPRVDIWSDPGSELPPCGWMLLRAGAGEHPRLEARLRRAGASRAVLVGLAPPGAGPRPLLAGLDPPDVLWGQAPGCAEFVWDVLALDRRQAEEGLARVRAAALEREIEGARRQVLEERWRRGQAEALVRLGATLRERGSDLKASLRVFAEVVARPLDCGALLARDERDGVWWVARPAHARPEEVQDLLLRLHLDPGPGRWYAVDAELPGGIETCTRSLSARVETLEVHLVLRAGDGGRDPDRGWLEQATWSLATHLEQSAGAERGRRRERSLRRRLSSVRAGLRLTPLVEAAFEDLPGAARWLWQLRQRLDADAVALLVVDPSAAAARPGPGAAGDPAALMAIDGDASRRDVFLRWALDRLGEPAASLRVHELFAEGRRLAPLHEIRPRPDVPEGVEAWPSRIDVPFRAADGARGVLCLGAARPRAFAPEVAVFLRTAARAVSRSLPAMTRRERERALLLQQVLEDLPVGVMLLDATGTLPVVNRAARSLLGLSDHPLSDLAHLERATGIGFALLQEEIEGGESRVSHELTHGGPPPRELRLDAVRVSEGRTAAGAALIAVHDVTEQRLHERAQSEFAGVVSHELKTPLTSMRTALELLSAGEAGSLSADQQRFLELTLRNVDRLGRLVQRLLDAARRDLGRLTLRRETQPLREVLSPALASLVEDARRRGRRLSLQVDPTAKAFVDRDRVVEIVENLVGNALKFTADRGSIEVRIRGSMPCPLAGTRAAATALGASVGGSELEVVDDGAGMSPQARERAFEPFYQGGDILADRPDGAGLGLHLTRSLVHAHDGEIELQSERGHGTVVRVWLPADAGAARLHGGLRRLRERLAAHATRLEDAVLEALRPDPAMLRVLSGGSVIEESGGMLVQLDDGLAVLLRTPRAQRPEGAIVRGSARFPEEGRRLGTLLALVLERSGRSGADRRRT